MNFNFKNETTTFLRYSYCKEVNRRYIFCLLVAQFWIHDNRMSGAVFCVQLRVCCWELDYVFLKIYVWKCQIYSATCDVQTITHPWEHNMCSAFIYCLKRNDICLEYISIATSKEIYEKGCYKKYIIRYTAIL